MAALRGMALLDTPCGADGRPAALVLVSRATLWLARAALRARPLEFDLVAYNKMFEDGGQPLTYRAQVLHRGVAEVPPGRVFMPRFICARLY